MRRLLIMCVVSIFPVASALAQTQEPEQPDSGWEVIQNCVGELPSSPLSRDQWNFGGVIFTDSIDGVRAIRADMATSYFVAFNGPSSFASAGSFSPNGQWYAYLVGETVFCANSACDKAYGIDAIRVVSTVPAQSMYEIPWGGFSFASKLSFLPRPHWISNDQFVAKLGDGGGIVNAFTTEVVPWDREISLSDLSRFSPDFTRSIYIDLYGERIAGVYDIENDTLLATWPMPINYYPSAAWMLDSSGVALGWPGEDDTVGSESTDLWWFDRNGQPIEMIISDIGPIHPVFSPYGKKLAFISDRHGLLVVDFTQKRIIDYCLGDVVSHWSEVVWSPDETSLAFDLHNMTIPYNHVLLNTATLEMKGLDLPGYSPMGWYPLP